MKISHVLYFVIGLVLGIALTGIAPQTRAQQAAKVKLNHVDNPHVVGGNGILFGFHVKVGGKVICSNPYVWIETRDIKCG